MNFRGLTFIIGVFMATSVFPQKKVNLGIVMDCPNSSARFLIDRITDEADILLKSDYELVLEDENVLESDCEMSDIETNIQRLLDDDDIDIVLGIDALSSYVLAKNGPYKKPVIASVILNAQVQEVPITGNGTSGVKNLNYLELPYSPLRDLEVFHEMIGFTNLALIADEIAHTGMPELRRYLEEGLSNLEVGYEFVHTKDDPDQVLELIGEEFDAVFFFPSDRLTDEGYQRLIDGVNEKKLKSFSLLGRWDVDKGVLGGVAPSSNVDIMSRRVALNIQRIASGEDPEDISVKLLQTEEFVINMATARKIDYSPNWETLSEALLINEERDDIERQINIFDAIKEGLEQNLEIDIAERDVQIVAEDVKIARSSLLPELTANTSQTLVDDNTASISNGQNPQRRGLASLQLSQVIYAEPITANNQIQRYLLKATQASLESQFLDVVLDVSVTYLNLMQTKTVEGIQKQNLEVTRKNLELARVSSSLGQSGPSDLYRWQGEIANAKTNLLNATANRKKAELALNQILNRPIDELFQTEEIDIGDDRFISNSQVVENYVQNPRQFYQFADFMVSEAKLNTPDLRQFDFNLKAQERSVLLNERNRYVPTVTVGGSYNYELYRNGSGTEVPVGFGTPNDWNWNLQLGASLPIFQGGNRSAKVQQSRIQLSQLTTQRLNTERLIEQGVRSEMENIRASFTNIELTRDAEEATTRNFNLVQDAYAKGVVTITQLLDAQNAAISARLNSANATYIFLIDLLNMERAVGTYYMLMTDEQKEDYVNRLVDFYNP